jgi:hypothetical protein
MGAPHLIWIKERNHYGSPSHVDEIGCGGTQKQNVAVGLRILSYATVSDKWQLLKL